VRAAADDLRIDEERPRQLAALQLREDVGVRAEPAVVDGDDDGLRRQRVAAAFQEIDELGERDDVVVVLLEVIELVAELLGRRGVAELLLGRIRGRGPPRNGGVRRRGVDLVVAEDRRDRRLDGGEGQGEEQREYQGAEAGHPTSISATEVPLVRTNF